MNTTSLGLCGAGGVPKPLSGLCVSISSVMMSVESRARAGLLAMNASAFLLGRSGCTTGDTSAMLTLNELAARGVFFRSGELSSGAKPSTPEHVQYAPPRS